MDLTQAAIANRKRSKSEFSHSSGAVISSLPSPSRKLARSSFVCSATTRSKFIIPHLQTPGIVLRAEDVLGFARDARAEAEGQTRSIREAAKRLGCDREAIPWLTQNGHLEWVQGSLGRRVTVTSLDRFVSRFVPLATLAHSLGTSARWLRSECDRRGIGLVEAQRHRCRSVQCFIGRPDAEELTAHIST